VGVVTGVLTLVLFGSIVRNEAANVSRAAAHLAARPEHDPAIGRRVEPTADHRILMRRLGQDLAAQRCTLPQAVERLATSAALQDPQLRATLRQRLPGRPEAESLAAVLMEVALQEEQNPATIKTLTARLRAEFQATYGTPAPQRRGGTR
jgi:hypothetical protein